MQRDGILIRASIFTGFAAYMSTRGGDAGLDLASFGDPDEEIPVAHVEAVLSAAAEKAHDPCIGLHWAESYPQGATGVYGYLLKNTQNLGDALRVVERYLSLFARPLQVSLTHAPDVAMLSWNMTAEDARATPQVTTFCVAATVLRLKAIAGLDWRPRAVHLMIDPLPCRETVTRILGPAVTFNSDANVVVVDAAYLTRGPAKTDRRLFDLIRQLGDRMLAERPAQDDAVSQTQKAIVERLESGDISLELIAGDLDLPPRTLQSRLAHAGSSFETVLNDTRSSFARHYLLDTQMPLTEIAMLLGFSELSAFTRAAQRWFGVAPSVYRRQFRK